jgi:hypothetical protein
MRIITNEGLIKRYARLGTIASFGGLLILVVGMVMSFREDGNFSLSLGLLLFGFMLSQVGIYLGNRYARLPRPDQAMNKALKGLERRYSIYHFVAPSAHLLVGPAGIWVVLPKPQRGHITFDKGRWRQRGGLGLAYMRIFAQESIGRPDLEIGAELEGMHKFLKKEIPDVEFPAPQAVLLFTNEKTEVDAPAAPVATLKLDALKEFIRQQQKTGKHKLTAEQIAAIQRVLEAGIAGAKAGGEEQG